MQSIFWDWARRFFPITILHLEKSGVPAWLAGGCVRDFFLRRTPTDLDLMIPARDYRLHDRLGEVDCSYRTNRHNNRRYQIGDERVDLIWSDCFYGQSSIQDAISFFDVSVNCMGVLPDGELFDPLGAREELHRREVRTNPRRWGAQQLDDFEMCHLMLRLARYQERLELKLKDPENVRPHVHKLETVEWTDLQRYHQMTREEAISRVQRLTAG